jgi:hypothetical protein
MKTPEQKLNQVKRIMKLQRQRGENNEKINTIYRSLLGITKK